LEGKDVFLRRGTVEAKAEKNMNAGDLILANV